jgi:dTDP-4-amino-4,6-dideoxygalactose transaminase
MPSILRKSWSLAARERSEAVHRQSADWIPILRPQLPDAKSLLPYIRRIDECRIYTNWGPLASELERRLSNHWQLPDDSVVSASSGTMAVAGAILATAGRARPDRPFAIVPAYTFVASALAAEQCGYRPYIADINPNTWQLNLDALESDLLAQTGVVIAVAPFGRAVEQNACGQFQQRTGVPVVIDGGASFEMVSDDPQRYIGEIPVAMSFHATKSFSTAEGGCVAVRDPALATRVTQGLNFGFYTNRECVSPSTNGKMSEYHAAVGLAELDSWPAKRQALRAVADRYRNCLQPTGLADRFIGAPTVASCYALWPSADVDDARRLQEGMKGSSIEFRLWYGNGLHTQPYYRDTLGSRVDVTNRLAPLILGLPVAPDLSEDDVERVVAVLNAAVTTRSR